MGTSSEDKTTANIPEEKSMIVCKVGAWYFRRMALMALIFLGMSGWFFYDYKYGWPKESRIALAKDAYLGSWKQVDPRNGHDPLTWDETLNLKNFEDYAPSPKEQEELRSYYEEGKEPAWTWPDYAKSKGWTDGKKNGLMEEAKVAFEEARKPGATIQDITRRFQEAKTAEEIERQSSLKDAFEAGQQKRSWDKFAAAKGWPSSPKYRSKDDLMGQAIFTILMMLGVAAVIAQILYHLTRSIRADNATFWKFPKVAIPFSEIFRVDRVKWEKKGLAFLHYRENGKEKKAILDDLKYPGAQAILDRIVANAPCEIVDLADPDDEKGEEPSEKKD